MPPLCKGRCPSSQTGAEGLGGRHFDHLKPNANSYCGIVPFRIGLRHHFGAYCPIPPTPLYTRGACVKKPEPGSVQPTDKLQFSGSFPGLRNRRGKWSDVSPLPLNGYFADTVPGRKPPVRRGPPPHPQGPQAEADAEADADAEGDKEREGEGYPARQSRAAPTAPTS